MPKSPRSIQFPLATLLTALSIFAAGLAAGLAGSGFREQEKEGWRLFEGPVVDPFPSMAEIKEIRVSLDPDSPGILLPPEKWRLFFAALLPVETYETKGKIPRPSGEFLAVANIESEVSSGKLMLIGSGDSITYDYDGEEYIGGSREKLLALVRSLPQP